MMGRGFAPYRQIFSSQPPLWLPLIYASFRLFGESFLAGQLVTTTAGMVAIVAVMLMTRQLGGRGSSIIAGTLMILSPLELEGSRLINADIPSVALAAVGVALAVRYANNGHRGWLAAASIATIFSILLKLLGLFAVPSLVLFAAARWKHAHEIGDRQRRRFIVQDVLIIFGILAGITLLSLALVGSDRVWNQVITFHWAAREVYSSVPDGKWHMLAQLFVSERLLILAAPLAPLCLLSGIDGLALFAWPCLTFFAVLGHRPLYDHHMVALIPALAAAIGVGAGHLGFVFALIARWISLQPRPVRIIGRTACVMAGLAFLGVGVNQAWTQVTDQQTFMRDSAFPSPDLHAVDLIVKNSQSGDMIITDAQGIAFLANRNVPPDLADTSFTRIFTGYLRPREVIDQGEQYHARLMLIWTWRLMRMPEVMRWAEKRFSRRIELGNGRVLYLE